MNDCLRILSGLLVLVLTLRPCDFCAGADLPVVEFASPVPWQVIQRQGFVPQDAHEHHPGGPVLGFADVEIRLKDAVEGQVDREYRVLPSGAANAPEEGWAGLAVTPVEGSLIATIRVDAGGWYRLEVRSRRGTEVLSEGSVEPFGVGEVFLIAGQSYASNSNEERLRVQDAQQRVAAFDHATGRWRAAHDPQPTGDRSDGGSIWPAFGDLLLPGLRVPVGLANVAVGGTSTAQWLPEGPLHARLVQTGRVLGRFRAVLWQQGESDVIGKVTTDTYVANVRRIRTAAAEAWKIQPPWMLAKSTLHPTVYNNPAGEAEIRRAIDQLCREPGFRHGPDTDVLGGQNRGGMGTRRHFSAIGQRNAASLWFAVVHQYLNEDRPEPEPERVLRHLPE